MIFVDSHYLSRELVRSFARVVQKCRLHLRALAHAFSALHTLMQDKLKAAAVSAGFLPRSMHPAHDLDPEDGRFAPL
jgi:hypothetical protein